MWEFGNFWTEAGRNYASPMAPLHATMHDIHVLLVDHDSEALINTAKALEMCQYRVTFVELASAAISMLLSGKAKFDVVMANINSPDLHGFKLLQHAVTMGIPVVLMSVDDNAFMAMRALENGAFLFIKKPATMEILRCLWQHVLREKRMIRERDMFIAANNNNNGSARGIEFRDVAHHHQRELESPNNNTGGMAMMNDNGKYINKKKKMRHDGVNEDIEECKLMENHMRAQSSNVRRKMCTEWTQELHDKFMNAVEQLGEGRCFPKDILQLMNVPGLTRMQVASHLQKCRNDNWRSPEERKPNQTAQATTQDTNGSQHKPRTFGSKPQVRKTASGRVEAETQATGQGSDETNSETETPTNIRANIENGSSMTNASDQHQYGSMAPGPSNAGPGTNTPSNHRQSSDEFFNFPDMDCLIQNLSGGRQGYKINNPSPAQGDPTYNNEQNSGGKSVETRSKWRSDTSNFDSDHSETRGPDDHE